MKIPVLNNAPLSSVTVESFAGIDKSDSSLKSFRDTVNMTCESYPAMTTRNERGILNVGGTVLDIMSADLKVENDIHSNVLIAETPNIYKAFYEENGQLVSRNLMYTSFLPEGKKCAVRCGAYLYFFPDKKYINLMNTNEKSGLEYSASYELGAKSDGYFYEIEVIECDSEGTPVTTPAGYIRITRKTYHQADGVKGEFNEDLTFTPGLSIDDSVLFSGFSDEVNGYHEVSFIPQNRKFLVFAGTGNETVSSGNVSIKRDVPDMDFIIAAKNRLWGCKYGTTPDGKAVNEIYASALGDAKNWHKFRGVSTDSWTATIGTPGAFTGAVCFDGNPVFFKENSVLKIFGDHPAEFTISESRVRGVEKGSDRSIAVVDDILYYKTATGIVRYDGGIPQNIDASLGGTHYKNAIAGAYSHCYYVAMDDDSGNNQLFVYDTLKGIWHRQDSVSPVCFANCGSELYMLGEDGTVYSISGQYNSDSGMTGRLEDKFAWSFEGTSFGYETPENKSVRHLVFDTKSSSGTEAEIFIEYDDSGEFERVAFFTGENMRRSIRIRPRRCKSFRYKISGKGDFTLRSVSVRYEKRSLTVAPEGLQ